MSTETQGMTLIDAPTLKINESMRVTMDKVDAQVTAAEKILGATAIVSGLGLDDGQYTFTTAQDADFVVLRPVTSVKTGTNINYLLSGLIGTVTGGKLVTSKTFNDKTMFVLPLDWVKKSEPNTAYTFKVKESRVISFIKALTVVEPVPIA